MNSLNKKRRVSISVPSEEYASIKNVAANYNLSMDAVGAKLASLGLKLWKEHPELLNFCPCPASCCPACKNIEGGI